MLAALVAGMTAGVLTIAPVVPPSPSPTPDGVERVLGELLPRRVVGLGVTHRAFTTTKAAGEVMGNVVEVDLDASGVWADLLTAGAVAARSSVAEMANHRGAVAGSNGDFFDIGGTSAPVGPAVASGRPLKAAVPDGRRMGPAVPAADVDYVFTVGVDGIGRIDRLRLSAEAATEDGTLPVVALNQYAVPVDGIGIFTADWGSADRAKTLCGTDTDRDAPCAADQAEVLVHDGKVVHAGQPGPSPVPSGDVVLAGREQGADSVRSLEVGDPVAVEYALVPASGKKPYLAVGGSPIMFDGTPVDGLNDRDRAPRSAVGVSRGGRHMWLLTLDGRQSDSVGATLAELASLLREMGVEDAVNLDGGGSSTLVYREPGAAEVTVVNDPSDEWLRLVPNGIGVFTS